MQTYETSIENGSAIGKRTAPVHPETQGMFIEERNGNVGSTSPMKDVHFPASALSSYDFFEYYNGETDTYHRMPVGQWGELDSDPTPLLHRHSMWQHYLGKNRKEINDEIVQKRKRAVVKAVQAEGRRREAEAHRKEIEEHNAQLRADAQAAYEEKNGTVEDEIKRAIAAAFADDSPEQNDSDLPPPPPPGPNDGSLPSSGHGELSYPESDAVGPQSGPPI